MLGFRLVNGQESTIRDIILVLLSLLYNDLNSSNKVKWKRHYTSFNYSRGREPQLSLSLLKYFS